MANIDIISQIKRKNGQDYDIYQIGPELRYTGALMSSNNNNLEEFLLLGTDGITKTWQEGNTIKKVIEFKKRDSLTGVWDDSDYYILEIEEDLNGQGGNIQVSDEAIDLEDVMSFNSTNQGAVEDAQDGYLSYSNDAIYISQDVGIERQQLFYKDKDKLIQPVAVKDVLQTYEDMGGNTVKVTKEIIKNLLN